ncbi:hypothetical protein ACFPVY_04030 [Flavobacterium qiangtangense]|uniref:Uncharacterized protein n=1 Tax=Flavobacterium qiangtangense TaxID=1442595 RepID=A0ABW1PK59_9FLAO
MFKIIHQMLQLDDFYKESKAIDIAKGIDRYPETFTEVFKMVKRKLLTPKNDKTDSRNPNQH